MSDRAARARPAFRVEADRSERIPARSDGPPTTAAPTAALASARAMRGWSGEAAGGTATRIRTAMLAGDGVAAFAGAALPGALAAGGAEQPSTTYAALLAAVTLPGAVRILQPPSRGAGGLTGARVGLAQLLTAGIATMPLAALAAWLTLDLSLGELLLPWAGALLVLGLVRIAWSLAGRQKRERVVVVGTGTVARRFPALVRRHPERALEVIGFIRDNDAATEPIDGVPVLGHLSELSRVVALSAVDRVIVACDGEQEPEVLRVLQACGATEVTVDVVPRFFQLIPPDLASYTLGSVPIITVSGTRPTLAERITKRTLDVALAVLLTVLLSPVVVAIALAIALEDGRPIFFRQRRIGRRGVPFHILKFRTMRAEPEPQIVHGEGIERAVLALKTKQRFRLTRIGDFLRSTSLDEIPQLVNVLRGEMSMVGPRPLRPFELQALDPWQQRARLEVRPGITGLWQVSGRSLTTWEERMELDATYVRHRSLGADLRILLRTIPAVLTRRGAL
jgi:exopolysaccharide biosynthesis polyprenyl glycosylphosphotransferase